MPGDRRLSQVSNHIVQFNCLYRWHATTSQADEEWVEKLTTHTWPGKESDKVRTIHCADIPHNLRPTICHTDQRAGLQGKAEGDPEGRDRR